MKVTRKVRSVFSCLIFSSLLSQILFAETSSTSSASATTLVRPLIKPQHAEAIYRHLIEFHWTPQTGLFRSFPDSANHKFSQQASTYEQAAVGLLALRLGDVERAQGLLDFFKKAWASGPELPGPRHGMRGLVNFYNADFGTEGIEKTIHVGPNAWVGLFAAKFANARKDPQALGLALDIAYWLQNVVPHDQGGVAMGMRDDPQGAAWSKIYSTENNLSYYAFLTELLRSPRLEASQRKVMTLEKEHVENWLVKIAYDPLHHRMLRGMNAGGPDTMQALDTVTWLLASLGPRHLKERGIDPYALMRDAEKQFEVSVAGHKGVDPTDQQEADRVFADLHSRTDLTNRPESDRHRLIWYEGLGQYILAWSTLAEYASHVGEMPNAQTYMKKAVTLTRQFDQAALPQFTQQSAYPYATGGMFFRFGWGAPAGSDWGPASSLISGVWRCYVGLGYDPLSGREIGTIQRIALSPLAPVQRADQKPAVLYGTSEDMTSEAWRALNAGNWDHAVEQAEATIQEWSADALYQERKKQRDVGHLINYNGEPNERREIFTYWALNDVAAAYYILGQAQDHRRDYAKASRAFQMVVNHYPLAQIWDPKGWFWSPVDAITNDFALIDRSHYGWVVPQAFAQGSKFGKQTY